VSPSSTLTEAERYLRQLELWGLRVPNTRASAAHLAQGLVTLLAASRGAELSTVTLDTTEVVETLRGEWTKQLRAAWGDAVFQVEATAPVRATAVTRTKYGTFSLTPGGGSVVPLGKAREASAIEALEERGREHYAQLTKRGHLTRAEHEALAGVIAADRRLLVSGGDTPTTPGPALVGYDSNYTLATFQAPTALGLLLAAEPRRHRELVQRLGTVLADAGDPHTRLLAHLRLDAPRPGLSSLRLPVPRGARWSGEAERLYDAVDRLLGWSETGAGTCPKAEVLMGLTDLLALYFSTRVLTWAAVPDPRPASTALLVAPRGVVSSDARSVTEAARFTVARAIARLRSPRSDTPRLSEKSNHQPRAAALSLGASAGWFLPRDARGGARRYVSPGDSQLRVLVQSLVSPGEELSWSEFHDRAWKTYGLCLGGERRSDFTQPPHVDSRHVDLAGRLNQERMLMHGLARREADNVVIVDGGGR